MTLIQDALIIGLMSGTSTDGVDAVLCRIDGQGLPHALARQHRPYSAEEREQLLALNVPGEDELHRSQLAANLVADAYAQACGQLLQAQRLHPGQVKALGAHGQTVRHRPELGYTVQLLNAARLAEQTGIAVVHDFRSRDVAAGGQGAPLVPAFHAALLGAGTGRSSPARALLNLGGIANWTLLGEDGEVMGFDCGPANVLMDLWMTRHWGLAFDADGAHAAAHAADAGLLHSFLQEPYFAQGLPKSTGRDLFHEGWLASHLARQPQPLPAGVVLSTLCELTARTAAEALARHGAGTREVHVFGGGALNPELMRRLARHGQRLLPDSQWQTSDALGVPPMDMEAMAFAWLAAQHLAGRPGNHPAVTGAAGLRILGSFTPA